jgi:hypothetical protein
MSDLVINGTTFNGGPTGGNAAAWRPTGITLKEIKIGKTLPAADGTRNRVERAVVKRIWIIQWDETNNATMLTLRTIQRLTSTFSFTDLEGNSWTVQTEDDEFAPAWAFGDPSNNHYWNVTLTLYQH